MDHIPDDRPLLFVGNHTLFGILDVPLMFAKLYVDKGIYLRALGDHRHFKVPGWGKLLAHFGAVDGTRETCSALMQRGEPILVFPGGAREVTKRKGERYKLIWNNRIGFARMAVEHGCTIVPFAAVGVEDHFNIVLDGNDVLGSPLGRVVRSLGLREDFVPPLVTPGRDVERFYFQFCEPISTRGLSGDASEHAAKHVRDLTKHAIEQGMQALMERRAHDPDRYVSRRVARRISSML
jgi:1-acyl-sn-glycerol-3-phosphate acyltransferase